jgi:hypothetical protein
VKAYFSRLIKNLIKLFKKKDERCEYRILMRGMGFWASSAIRKQQIFAEF